MVFLFLLKCAFHFSFHPQSQFQKECKQIMKLQNSVKLSEK